MACNPVSLIFDRYGSATAPGGPPAVVLLHGFLGSARNLTTLARRWAALEPTRAFVAIDLPGHGRSPALAEGATLETLARAVLALAAEVLGAAPLALVGHSLGGRVALAALGAAPERIVEACLLDIAPGPVAHERGLTARTLALLATAPSEPPTREAVRAHLLGGGLPTAIVEWLLMNLVADAAGGLRWRIDRARLREAWPQLSAEDLWPVVARYPSQLRAVRGGASDFVSEADCARWVSLGAPPIETLRAAGHFLHVDAPAALLDCLRSPRAG